MYGEIFRFFVVLLLFSLIKCLQIGGLQPTKVKGSLCAYGDMDRDLYTDLIVHEGDFLKIHLQSEEGGFREKADYSIEIGRKPTTCAVGDFNGDAIPDILVTTKENDLEYTVAVYIHLNQEYDKFRLNETFLDELAIVDVNGDGISDLVGFERENQLYCRLGSENNGVFLSCESYFSSDHAITLFKGFPISFVDVTGDLSAEIIFGRKVGSNLALDVWKRLSNEKWTYDKEAVKVLNIDPGKFFGAPVFADFDADGAMDIAVPLCSDEYCRKVESIRMWTGNNWLLFPVTGLEGSDLVSSNEPVGMVFRVGDFTLDGFPDLIALVNETRQNPMILENTECLDCISNATRTFTLRTSPRLIQPSEVSLGTIQMASFFDLKEDGNLDVLLEYVSAEDKTRKDRPSSIDFIQYTDSGDTTFLKVEVFSSACTQDCGSHKLKIGSGIAWHGACISYNMSVSRGQEQRGIQCQMPQTSHRAFYSPFALFGLGRSPNFVDQVRIGSARLPYDGKNGIYGNQKYSLKQIVPNSRVIVVPPKGDGTYWQSRLYVTPSALIIQSLIVLVSVCSILLLIIAVLHFRERRLDKRERQAQSHRFHFDAM